ncbi:16S rRNA (adenine(1518)-N(6)/adenine(1519)-N(6))-dimethyltransferase RsmA [Mycoplasma sp. 1458C]|uniref:16S rRNA (adenine(1518)-N(6)/adenine(1519)-N(6))- dimethyltransferase RsmA n=1 Tax=unclassified Mycoplasma TaxID=2683645 RepID=UPI003AABB486
MKNNKPRFAKKEFGQNFLQDQNIINKIVQVFPITNQNVLEIGPGRGALTKALLPSAKSVISYEIDQDMVDILNTEIHDPKFHLIHQDFLQSDLNNIEESYLIANIPYYITTDILFKVFEHKEKFKGVLLMVQKEVAQRICAKINSSDYSKLSVSAQYLANCKIEFIVPRGCFAPAPKVDSAIISLIFKPEISSQDWNKHKDFFKLCFANRRKKLSYALSTQYSKEVILAAYKTMGYDDNIRIQQLTVEQIVTLHKLLTKGA